MSTKENETKKRIDFPYPPLTRQQFVKRGAAATAGLLLAACGQNGEEETAVNESANQTESTKTETQPASDAVVEEAGNASDGIYDERLLMETAETAEGMTGSFNFVS